MKTPLGSLVGYQVRFHDEVSEETAVKLMTDGILLNELQRDRDLRAYDTLIIDEAHERSLNIDFLLGYLKRLLPRRPDLKVIITSATIDTERFADHFGAPAVTVSGRTHPVEVFETFADRFERVVLLLLLAQHHELVVDGECGFVVPIKNARALADAFEKLYRDPELRRRMGEAARERIGTHFRNEDTVRKTIALYEELVPNPD